MIPFSLWVSVIKDSNEFFPLLIGEEPSIIKDSPPGGK